VVEVNSPPTLDMCFFMSPSHQNVTAATSVVTTSAYFGFYGGAHDEASIPCLGIEGAAGIPQVIGGPHSFAGRVQQAGSAAGSGWNKGGTGNPPPFSRTCTLTCLCCYTCYYSNLSCSYKWLLWSISLVHHGYKKCRPGNCTKNAHGAHHGSVISRLDMYRTNVIMYRTMVLLACLTKVRR
jgi:hypothetical protein